MWNNETAMSMDEKRGTRLNKDKGGLEISGSRAVSITGYLIAVVRNLLSTIIFNFSQCKRAGRGTLF